MKRGDFKPGDAEISKNKEYSNFLRTYFDADHAMDISGIRSVTSIVHLFNGNTIEWFAKKQYETSIRISNT